MSFWYSVCFSTTHMCATYRHIVRRMFVCLPIFKSKCQPTRTADKRRTTIKIFFFNRQYLCVCLCVVCARYFVIRCGVVFYVWALACVPVYTAASGRSFRCIPITLHNCVCNKQFIKMQLLGFFKLTLFISFNVYANFINS